MMEAFRIEKRIEGNGTLHLSTLPFREGEVVEVVILGCKREVPKSAPSPLRCKVIEYIDPTEPVAQHDWKVLR